MHYLDVPYFKQDTPYTCGPTSLQMVFSFYGITVSEAALAKEVESDAEVGTRHRAIIEAITSRGLHAYVNDNASLDELAYLLNDCAVPVIVRYLETDRDEDHYAVVVGLTESEIILNDPWHGPRVHFPHSAFESRWTCDVLGSCDQWLMAVSKKPLSLGKQYHPNAD